MGRWLGGREGKGPYNAEREKKASLVVTVCRVTRSRQLELEIRFACSGTLGLAFHGARFGDGWRAARGDGGEAADAGRGRVAMTGLRGAHCSEVTAPGAAGAFLPPIPTALHGKLRPFQPGTFRSQVAGLDVMQYHPVCWFCHFDFSVFPLAISSWLCHSCPAQSLAACSSAHNSAFCPRRQTWIDDVGPC